MAIAKRHQDGQHDWAVLVPNDHAYIRFSRFAQMLYLV
jgi:hypothetical protein